MAGGVGAEDAAPKARVQGALQWSSRWGRAIKSDPPIHLMKVACYAQSAPPHCLTQQAHQAGAPTSERHGMAYLLTAPGAAIPGRIAPHTCVRAGHVPCRRTAQGCLHGS